MPRRSADEGIKPFEFRVGVGGLPTLGGMYRSGDPATIPPHKHHLLANVRITPKGMISRPGLAAHFNTGVAECITGLTEVQEGQGASLILWPGAWARAGNGTEQYNKATFRAIFPGTSTVYSEFVFVLYGAAAVDFGNPTPIVSVEESRSASEPFLFNGRVHQLYEYENELGDSPRALLELPLPERAGVAAVNLNRSTDAGDGVRWPRSHPVSAAVLRAYVPDFFSGESWELAKTAGGPEADTANLGGFLARPERADNPLSGEPGVVDALYLLLIPESAAPILVRWDGRSFTEEYELNTADIRRDESTIALGQYQHGPFILYRTPDTGDPTFFNKTAIRGEDGSWTVEDGLGLEAGVTVVGGTRIYRAFDWGGDPCALVSLVWHESATNFTGIYVLRWDGDEWPLVAPLVTVEEQEGAFTWHVYDGVVVGGSIWVLWSNGGSDRVTKASFTSGVAVATVECGSTDTSPHSTQWPARWIQAAGDRVYLGGYFTGLGPDGQTAGDRHAVYDVTDIDSIFVVYEVLDSDQQGTEDESFYDGDSGDSYEDERYSVGALPALPGDDLDEGFGGGLGS